MLDIHFQPVPGVQLMKQSEIMNDRKQQRSQKARGFLALK